MIGFYPKNVVLQHQRRVNRYDTVKCWLEITGLSEDRLVVMKLSYFSAKRCANVCETDPNWIFSSSFGHCVCCVFLRYVASDPMGFGRVHTLPQWLRLLRHRRFRQRSSMNARRLTMNSSAVPHSALREYIFLSEPIRDSQ